MAQDPDSSNPGQPYLPPPPAAGRRGLPRPTPIGALVGIIALVLCLASVGLAALLTNPQNNGPAPTAVPPTAGSTAATTPSAASAAANATASEAGTAAAASGTLVPSALG